MTASHVRPGYAVLTPYLICRGAAEALAFYERGFGAREIYRLTHPRTGAISHAEFEIEGVRVMLADEHPEIGALSPQSLGGAGLSLVLYLPDPDVAVARAVDAGATLLRPTADQFHGDRSGMIRDPFGHVWTLAAHRRPMSDAEIQAGFAAMFYPG